MQDVPGARRRRPAGKFLLLGAIVMLLLPVFWLGRAYVEARRIVGDWRTLQAFEDEVRARDPARPPLLGAGSTGNAWTSYLQAAGTLRAMLRSGSYDVRDPSEPGLDLLRRGAASPDVSYGRDLLISDLADLLSCALDRAGRLHREGRDGDAMERVRLVLAVLRDMDLHGRHPRELAETEIQCHEMTFLILEKHGLGSTELREHAAFLDRFEELRPDLVLALRFALDPSPHFFEEPGVRFLFSTTLYRAAAIRGNERAFTLAKTLLPLEGRVQTLQRSNLPWGWQAQDVLRFQDARRAYARVARLGVEIAARERERGQFPDSLSDLSPSLLRCAYSGRPIVDRSKDGIVYSVGFDLDDDGGRAVDPAEWGHWSELRLKADGDLVVRVGRRK